MLKDIQSQRDSRNIDIDRVGIKDIVTPIILRDRSKGSQHTVATISMHVNLPHNFKGTHMSRFVAILNRHREDVSLATVKQLLGEMQEELGADESHVELRFPYFMEKAAPVSGQVGLMDYRCAFIAHAKGAEKDFQLSVTVPVTSLCPCSKEISEYGAHNQRSHVTITVRYTKMIWIEDLIEVAERSASSPIYSLLKREDEKFVTELAYNNPVFVEDIVRNVTSELMDDDRVVWFTVESENYESIHNHSAYAVITRDKRNL